MSDKPEDHPVPDESVHESLSEIIATGVGRLAPLQLGLVPIRWKDTGALSWIVARANPDAPRDADGRGRMEPLALMMDDELISRLDFGANAPPERVGDDERSQREVKADFGLPVETDDADLGASAAVEAAMPDIARIIQAMLDGSDPVKVVTIKATPDGGTEVEQVSPANPAAAWPWTTTETKQ